LANSNHSSRQSDLGGLPQAVELLGQWAARQATLRARDER
jgi:hypothetical protein